MTQAMKYPFKCASCGKDYPAGSQGWYSIMSMLFPEKTKKVYCKECLDKKKPDASPTSPQAGQAIESTTHTASGQQSPGAKDGGSSSHLGPPPIEQLIASRLHKAREIVRKEYALPEDVEDYTLTEVITEAFRQLGSESLTRRIQANKEKNIQAIR